MTIDLSNLPSYDQLPVKEGAPEGSAWGLFGDDDELGCLNLITPEKVVEAAKLVRRGAVFPLNLRLDEPSPPMHGRGALKHHLLDMGGGVARDDYLDSFYLQASTQWDGFRHIRHPRDGFYNGVTNEEIVAGDQGKLGVETFARKGIATRGVLLDVDRFLREQGTTLEMESSELITKDQLEACLAWEKADVRPGDILVIRTGWLRWYLEDATAGQREKMAGDPVEPAPRRGGGRQPGPGRMAAHSGAGMDALPPAAATGHAHRRVLVPGGTGRRLRERRRVRVHADLGAPEPARRRWIASQRPGHQVR